MTQDEIVQKIEDIYISKSKDGKPTGKNFITHLIRAYFPVGKIQKVWESPNKNLKCAITGYGLCTIDDAFTALHGEGMDAKLVEHLSSWAKGNDVTEHPLKTELKGKVIAYTGQKTDTVMCLESVQAFIVWTQNKILSGDKHLSWVMGDMKRKEVIKTIKEKLPNKEDQEKIAVLEKISKKPQRATMSLGDLTVLQQLKEKLKVQEENGEKK